MAFRERLGIDLSDSIIWGWMEAEQRDPQFVKIKGSIIAAYVMPPPHTRTIGLEEID
jgi:hypothetical protein